MVQQTNIKQENGLNYKTLIMSKICNLAINKNILDI